MDKIRNAISRFGGTVLITLGLTFATWGVLITNSRYPGATWMNVANWPDSSVPMPVTGGGAGGAFNANVTNFSVIVSETSFVGTRATAAFAAGQVINNGDNVAVPPFTITNACPVGRSGLIAFVALTASNTTFTPSIRIKFYSSTNVTWYSNSQAAGTYFTNASARLFNWDLQPLAAESSGDSASIQDVSQWIPFSATADGNLYFTPIALSAGTPVANQPYLLKIKVLPR